MLMSQRDAKKDGRARGQAAASWRFDGNTTTETYLAFLAGYDAGDPQVMDAYAPPSWLSGEHAGESVHETLGACESERDEDRLDGVMQAYEDAADQAYWGELQRVARHMTRGNQGKRRAA